MMKQLAIMWYAELTIIVIFFFIKYHNFAISHQFMVNGTSANLLFGLNQFIHIVFTFMYNISLNLLFQSHHKESKVGEFSSHPCLPLEHSLCYSYMMS